MYNNFTGSGSPPLPDIIGQYYGGVPTGGYGSPLNGSTGLGLGYGNAAAAYELYGPSTSTGYLYDPSAAAAAAAAAATAAQIYGHQTSPIRRRRYSIAGLPSATMYNDVYGYPAPPLHQTSSSNIVNLLNEAHKSISRSSQILNLSHQARQLGQQPQTTLVTTPLSGRVVSSYPTLHGLGGDISPPYLNDNLLQMSTSFSSQPNMYFQPTQQPTQLTAAQSAAAAAARLRPAYSVSNLMATGGYPASCKYGATGYANPYQSDLAAISGYGLGGLGPNLGSTLGLGGGVASSGVGGGLGGVGLGSGLGSTGLPAGLAAHQRHLMSHHSLHASNPAISQYYQQHSMPPSVYNLHQQFAGSQQQYGGIQQQTHHSQQPHSNIQASVQQQMNPQYQYHVHQHQNHLQTHPLAALANTSGPFGGTLASSARDAAIAAGVGGVGGVGGGGVGSLGLGTTGIGYEGLHHTHPHSSSHHPHSHSHTHHHHLGSGLTTYPHSHSLSHSHHQLQQQQHHQQQQQHHHHHLPYSKLDLDYPKLPQEHKRQVSFKFDVDQLSLDS